MAIKVATFKGLLKGGFVKNMNYLIINKKQI